MKRYWTTDELIDHWTLLSSELGLVSESKTDHNRLGFAALLKYFQLEGRFPQFKHEIPSPVLFHLAKQLQLSAETFLRYDWQGRSIKLHRAAIRTFFGYRETTLIDTHDLTEWLCQQVLPSNRQEDFLKNALYTRCRELQLEPPTSQRLIRLIHSAIHIYDERFCATIMQKLSADTRQQLDNLLVLTITDQVPVTDADGSQSGNTSPNNPNSESSPNNPNSESSPNNPINKEVPKEIVNEPTGYSALNDLKTDVGSISLESVQKESAKLLRLRELKLPPDLFSGVSPKILETYRQRIGVEELHEVKRHPDPIRYTLLSAYCHQRTQEITDTLVELLIDIVHRVGARAEQKVGKAFLKEFKRVRGKTRLLYEMAEAAVEQPDGIVKVVIFPVAPEQTLRELIKEFKATGTYDQQVQLVMRSSYSHHYRRMVPMIINLLQFRSNNEAHQPVIKALALLKQYAESVDTFYPVDQEVPLDGVVSADWREVVLHQSKQRKKRVNRINYELAVLETLRDKLRCKEVWVEGANHFRNPAEDLPLDFETQRTVYYQALAMPPKAEEFISGLQHEMKKALEALDTNIPTNTKVKLLEKGKGWISLTPLDAQAEPTNLLKLKAALGQLWPMTNLLDMLKEVEMRVGFTKNFKSATVRENLDPETLQRRLLLCLYGLGTNTGLKRISATNQGENYRDLLYVRRRFITKDHLRAAIVEVVNAIFKARRTQIWGEGTTACASDSKKFGAYDQNILTEWHIRYRGPGIMVYWHVERKAACIYSQLKSCSSSEVAAMIEGVLRHCTEMNVKKNYVDSHGQSEVAFAFCKVLGFQLLPRLKAIHKQKLYRPETGKNEAYPNLQLILTRPINWELIQQQYDEIIKYATALRLGTAEAEAILKRFTKSGLQHPTYKALAELGKKVKTIFLCDYLRQEELRQEIQEGLNVVENWNSANSFIFYGKSGEIATNRRDDQEVAILSLHLLQLCLEFVNTLMIQQILSKSSWKETLKQEDLRALTPLIYSHVNPYGQFRLDMAERIKLETEESA